MDDFRAQCRRQLKRSLDSRIKYGFVRNYKPIEDDEPVRIFERMSDYRKWAHEELPRYFGYRIVNPPAEWKQFDVEKDDDSKTK